MHRAAWAALLAPSLAWGHAGDIVDTIGIHAQGESLLLEMTVGIFLTDDRSSWDWTCHEAITQPSTTLTPTYGRTGQGTLLGSIRRPDYGREVGSAVYRSEDACTWSVVPSLDGQFVAGLVADPAEPTHILAWTDDGAGTTQATLWRSTDDGLSFTSVLTLEAGWRLRSLVSSPDHAGVFWASASHGDSLADRVLTSDDGGQTWSSIEVDVADDVDVAILTIDPADPANAWVRLDVFGADALGWATDHGAALSTLTELPHILLEVEPLGSATWVTVLAQPLASWDGTELHPQDGSPRSRAIQADGSGLLVSANQVLDAHSLARLDSDEWQVLFDLNIEGQLLVCPEGTHTAEVCAPLWELGPGRFQGSPDTGDTGDTGTDTGDTDTDDGGCKGCSSASPAFALWMALPLLGLLRRRS